jgi:hypothetical protein
MDDGLRKNIPPALNTHIYMPACTMQAPKHACNVAASSSSFRSYILLARSIDTYGLIYPIALSVCVIGVFA